MNKVLYIFLLLTACNLRGSKPDGAYKASRSFRLPVTVAGNDSTYFVKILKDGFWIAAVYGKGYQSMYSCCGGTYHSGSRRYAGKVDYFSPDTALVGKEYGFQYATLGNKYVEDKRSEDIALAPYIQHNEFEKITTPTALKNDGMEGVWKIVNGQVGYTRNGDEYIKIYAYPRYAWAHYNTREKRLIAAGGGTYQFDGDIVTETIEYSTYKVAFGTAIESKVTKLSKQKVMLYVIDSFYDEEIWTRIK